MNDDYPGRSASLRWYPGLALERLHAPVEQPGVNYSASVFWTAYLKSLSSLGLGGGAGQWLFTKSER
jgi:hypothetical protein